VIRIAADHDHVSMRYRLLTVLLTGTLTAGCSADDPAAPATPAKATAVAPDATNAIRIVDFVYEPSPARVRVGRRISIPNADAAPHTITDAGAGRAFDSGTIKGRATGSLTIDEPGSYRYVCEFHPFMKGQITVTR